MQINQPGPIRYLVTRRAKEINQPGPIRYLVTRRAKEIDHPGPIRYFVTRRVNLAMQCCQLANFECLLP